MKGIRYSTEQKFRILRGAKGSGKTIKQVCRGHQISEQNLYRWKRAFGMLENRDLNMGANGFWPDAADNSFLPPPHTGNLHNWAMAFMRVDLPHPFSPTRKVTGQRNSRSS
jgi:hypothetical protein